MLLCNTYLIAAEKQLNIATLEYPPYCSQQLPGQGFVSEIVIEAYKRVGYRATITFYPWSRAMMLARKGKVEALAFLWHSKKRAEWLVFSDPFELPTTMVFLKNKKRNIKFRRYEDLKDYRIGYILGYAYAEAFYEAPLRRFKTHSNKQLMDLLIRDKIELAITDKIVGMSVLRSDFPQHYKNFDAVEPPIETRKTFLAVSKTIPNHNSIVEDFNRGMELIKNDGTFKKILKKHNIYEFLLSSEADWNATQ